MTNQPDSDAPSTDPEHKSPSQSQATQSTNPQQNKMGKECEQRPNKNAAVSEELAREFKWVECAQIVSSAGLLIVGIIALCIYSGQLQEMRRSTKAAQDAADAALSAARTADASLKFSRDEFRMDQRPYIWIANPMPGIADIEPHDYTSGTRVFVRFTNFGKSPAAMVRHYHGIYIGDLNKKDFPVSRKWVTDARIVPPGRIDQFEVDSNQPIATPADPPDMRVYATWQYKVVSGHLYETEWCEGRHSNGGWNFCTYHIGVKDCSQEKCEE